MTSYEHEIFIFNQRQSMAKSKSKLKLVPFDAAKYLTDEDAIAEYMSSVLEEDDMHLLLLALGDVA